MSGFFVCENLLNKHKIIHNAYGFGSPDISQLQGLNLYKTTIVNPNSQSLI